MNPIDPAGSAEVATRHSPGAQALHWISAILMAAVLPLAWVATSLSREAPAKATYFMLHKSVGLTLLALCAARIAWRIARPAPPPTMPKGLALLAGASHWLLYAVLVVMPVSGYLVGASRGRDMAYFGLFTIPGLPRNDALHTASEAVHLIGQWAVYALVAAHIAATIWHVAIRRDGTLDRMLPRQDGRSQGAEV